MCHQRPRKVAPAWLLQLAALFFAFDPARAADYYVDPNDQKVFATVQAAVDAVAGQSEFDRANIFIAPGIYHEIVTVNKPYVSFIGRGDSPKATTITFARAFGDVPGSYCQVVEIGSDATAFMARNLTFENSTADKNVAAALALRSSADRSIFDDVRVLGYQDTLLVDESSRQYFRNSFITGDTDFIFGDATAVFDQCTIESTDFGWVTAANTYRTTANGLIFLDCALVPGTDRAPGDDHTTALPGSVFLGRPWEWWNPLKMPSVIFIRTKMGPHIAAAGWDPWNGIPGVNSDANRDPVTRVSEFGSLDLNGNPLPDRDGDGTPNGRVSWVDPMSQDQAANYTLEHIFGPVDFWNAATQPEASGAVYESQGEPWNATGQLALLPTQAEAPSQPLNISTRLEVQTGNNVLIAGFILTGTESTQVLLRALGPSLRAAEIANPLADPVLELRAADGTRLAFNDNWRYAQAQEIIATGIPPADDHEAAIIATLPPGAYTAIVEGQADTTGVALVEIYSLGGTSAGKLANISTRGFIRGAGDVMIAGFILGGGTGSSRVVVRAIGPSLSSAGIMGALSDPTLELHNGNGVAIAFNNDWRDTQGTQIVATSLAPPNDRESAIVMSLPPGPYTAVLASGNGGTGIGVVEVYDLGR